MPSGRIRGVTIEIDGETKNLQKSLKDVDKDIRDTQKDLKDVNKLLKLDPKNVDLLKQRHELLGKAVTDTKKRQEELEKALEASKAAGSTEEQRKEQDLLQRELVETQSKLEDLEKQYGNALTPQLQAVSAISGEVAEKTKGISTAAGIAAGGMLAMAYNAATTADDLLTLSNVTGFSVEELQKLQYASSFVDVSMETMTGSVTKLTKNMASGNKVFDQLGISITDQNGNMRDATDVWYEALEALGKVENETERDQLSMELFGKSAMEMAGIVDDGGAALKALGEEAEATGNILSQDAVEDAVAFNDQMDELKGKATMAFFEAGAALADTLVPALETLVDVITTVLSWFGNLDGSTQAFILTVLGLVAAISPIAGIISTITGVAAALNVAMLPMIGTIAAIVAGVAAAVAIGVALYQNWDTIKQKASELASNLKQKFEDIKQSISEKIEAAKQKVHDAIEAIKGFFNFKFEWPKMSLPHFSVSGSLNPINWLKTGLPKISVDWYAKAMDRPMLLDGATIFGARGNTLLGGGEAGKEVILGLDKLREYAGGTMNFNVVINQQPGQSAEDLAKVVSRQIQKDIMNKKAVWQ